MTVCVIVSELELPAGRRRWKKVQTKAADVPKLAGVGFWHGGRQRDADGGPGRGWTGNLGVKLAAGVVEIRSRITHAQLDFNFAVLHAGGHNLRAGVCEAREEFPDFIKEACLGLSEAGFNGCLRALDHYFGGETYSLKSLFRDERKRIVAQIVDSALADIDKLYGDVYEHNVTLIDFLRDLAVPLPPILRVSSEFVLNNSIRRAVSSERVDFERVRLLIRMAAQTGVELDEGVKLALRERLERTMYRWSNEPFVLQTLSELEQLISLLQAAPFETDLWEAQNTYYESMKAVMQLEPKDPGDMWREVFGRLGNSLGIGVPRMALVASEKKFTVASVPPAQELQLSISADN